MLFPEANPVLLADPGSSVHARAQFATNHLWVTRYEPSQRYPAGDYVNQHPGGAGVAAFGAGDQRVGGEEQRAVFGDGLLDVGAERLDHGSE